MRLWALPILYKNRSKYSSCSRPSEFCPLVYGRATYSTIFTPLGDRLGDSVDGEMSVSASVTALLLACRPSAIFWRVAFFIVNSVNRGALRPCTHISEKEKEVIPASADINSSAAVIWVMFIIRIIAPRPHHTPRVMLSSFAESVVFLAFWLCHNTLHKVIHIRKVVEDGVETAFRTRILSTNGYYSMANGVNPR